MLIKYYFGRYIVLGVSCLNKLDAQPRELSDLVTLRSLVVPSLHWGHYSLGQDGY